jgi:hypothetical protein
VGIQGRRRYFEIRAGKGTTIQVGLLNPVSYAGNPTTIAWPVPPALCNRAAVSEAMRRAKEQLRLADELGFDWVSVDERRVLLADATVFTAVPSLLSH